MMNVGNSHRNHRNSNTTNTNHHHHNNSNDDDDDEDDDEDDDDDPNTTTTATTTMTRQMLSRTTAILFGNGAVSSSVYITPSLQYSNLNLYHHPNLVVNTNIIHSIPNSQYNSDDITNHVPNQTTNRIGRNRCRHDDNHDDDHHEYWSTNDADHPYINDDLHLHPVNNKNNNSNNNNNTTKTCWWLYQLRLYLFGFMYEEIEMEDSIDYYRSNNINNNTSSSNSTTNSTRSNHPPFPPPAAAADVSSSRRRRRSWTQHPSFLYLMIPLSTSLAIQSMATSMIYSILSFIGQDILSTTTTTTTNNNNNINTNTTLFLIQPLVQHMVSVSLCGTAMGKFSNGPIVDIYGARRTAILSTCLLCIILFVLAHLPIISTTYISNNSNTSTSNTSTTTIWILGTLIFLMEFVSSVQWPCTIVILATHYRSTTAVSATNIEETDDADDGGMVHHTTISSPSPSFSLGTMKPHRNSSWYESGVFIASLSSRIGSMMGILFASYLTSSVHHQQQQQHHHDPIMHWRTIVYISTYLTAIATSIIYLYIWDTPRFPHAPQNPIDPNLYRKWFPEQFLQNHRWSINRRLRLLIFIVQTNVVPSVRHILGSSTFWIVTLSHTGTSMVRTSQRLLGSYFFMTSDGTLSYEQAVSQSIWYSTGTVLGLFIAGTIFTKGCRDDRQRKYMILRLYVMTIVSCYVLSIMAIPGLRKLIQAPDLIRIIQTMAVTAIGFGVAVQLYHIPSLVGATFGCDKGLFVSYNDGVAYLFVAVAWRYVGRAMQVDDNHYDSQAGGGWAYGWAAVALLLIVSAFLMVEFMEHYFCRPKYGSNGGTYETIIFS